MSRGPYLASGPPRMGRAIAKRRPQVSQTALVRAGTLVKLARIEAGLTQRQLAALTGVSTLTIGRVEAGRHDHGVGLIALLIDACGAKLTLGIG